MEIFLLSKISIHAPRVGCDPLSYNTGYIPKSISIHAPRVGCDFPDGTMQYMFSISIHAPRVGCDILVRLLGLAHIFQSTHPVWGATNTHHMESLSSFISIHAPRVGCDSKTTSNTRNNIDFNPRTPCGVRRTRQSWHFLCLRISIHAPRVGCDSKSIQGTR